MGRRLEPDERRVICRLTQPGCAAVDPTVWDLARERGFVIVSKDSDFEELSDRLKKMNVKGRDEFDALLKAQGLSIVLVEQNAKLVFDVADDIVILNSGRVVVEGPADELRSRGIDLRQHLGIY